MAFAALDSLDYILGIFRDMTQSDWDEFELQYTLHDYVFLRGGRSFRKVTQSEWEKLDSLRRTLQRLDDDCYRGIDRTEIYELEAKITEAVWKVEDVIESYQVISEGVDEEGLEQEIHSFFTTAKQLREEYERALQNSCVAVTEEEEEEEEEDHITHHAANSSTVGLLDLSEEIITGILDDNSKEEEDEEEEKGKIFSILGMAGIGKTHLARDIYHHPLIVQRFELRLWVSIGPIHKDMKNIFVDILAQIESKPRDLFNEIDEPELRDLLHKSLLDRAYLVVFDDVWSVSVMGDCIAAFPHYQNEKSMLITTRLYDVAATRYGNKFRPKKSYIYKMYDIHFLSNEESWKLLSQNVFAEKPFPIQLEKAGRKIAEICEGLPLLILAVADILRGLDQTEECWNKVAEKKTTTFPDAYDRIYKVLLSSYDYLPQKYKACFLYMGVFRQSKEILVSRLINLWKFEGFSGDHQTLEVLFSSSIAIPCKHNSYDKILSCKLHSAYWYVCATEARKIKLFHVLIKLTDVSIENPRRLSVQNNMLFGLKQVSDSMAANTSLTRSLLFTGEDHQYPVQICFTKMLLMKVLDALAINFYEFPNEVLNLLQLRYLSLTHNGVLPSSISKLQRLHHLFIRRHHNIIKLVQGDSPTFLPKEIWDFQGLSYLRIMGSKLPNPSHDEELPNLSRLYVNADSCTEGVLRGTPALKKLGIEIELEPEGGAENSLRCLEHTRILDKLESLKCVVVNPRFSSHVVAPPNHLSNLPRSLTKLSLKGMGYPWKYMSAIGSLPNLRVLKLRCSAFRGPEWEIKEGQFKGLRYLVLEDLDVEHLTVGKHIKYLFLLIVRHCYKLKMISYNYIGRLRKIEVDECHPSIVEFAQQIKDSSPPHPKVVINSSWNL